MPASPGQSALTCTGLTTESRALWVVEHLSAIGFYLPRLANYGRAACHSNQTSVSKRLSLAMIEGLW